VALSVAEGFSALQWGLASCRSKRAWWPQFMIGASGEALLEISPSGTDAKWHPRPVGRGQSGGGGGGNRTRVRKPYVPGPTCL